jgi:glycosyltransferase involved in cell wall biosynthesis
VYLKGYDVLLHAVASVRCEIPVGLVFIGDGEERSALVALATRLGLEDDVRFVGWQRNPWAYLRNARVLAMSSRTEAFPSVLTEAMAVGVPIVAAECSAGVRECLDGGKAGLLVPPDDAPALAQALRRVLSCPALGTALSVHGTQHVAQFALERRVAAYETMLLETDAH